MTGVRTCILAPGETWSGCPPLASNSLGCLTLSLLGMEDFYEEKGGREGKGGEGKGRRGGEEGRGKIRGGIMAYSRSADPSRPRVEYLIMQVEKGHEQEGEREREAGSAR